MTVEFAVLMPAMVVLLAVVLSAGSAAMGYLQCLDAARAAARLAARHEEQGVIDRAVRHLGPKGAVVATVPSGDEVTVRVSAGVVLPLPWHPRIVVVQQATARLEGP